MTNSQHDGYGFYVSIVLLTCVVLLSFLLDPVFLVLCSDTTDVGIAPQ